jgi:DNA-binding PadR family transcriptional regulator
MADISLNGGNLTSQTLPLSPLSLAILTALLEGERHGYGIIKQIETHSGGQLKPGAGSLYAALDRLVADGAIAERSVRDVNGEDRRRFRLTAQGRRLLRSEYARLEVLVAVARAHGLSSESA